MPSGFQQDQNQLTPSYYRVVISCGNNSAFWYATDDNNGPDSTGRISPYAYDNFSDSGLPSTVDYSRSLARGNLRFQGILSAIENLADCQILDVEVDAELTANAQADNQQIAFTVKFDRDEGVFPAYCAIRKQEGANSNGTTNAADYDGVSYPQYYLYVDNGDTANNIVDCLRDTIWKSLATGITRSTRVFRTLLDSDPRTGEGFQEVLTASKPFNNDSNAYNDISVNEIDGTTTTLVSNY
ncbi:hypothetical protein UFOVP181_110 [uncultured Caudovirales phage]|uniref:Uncharacterized protein n=1 Tax=uncultured Caudovirales phage TaxID=2100421 RepID=A0A6J5KVC5_9CAUD|nr:hypothetical protein UFOVP57_52 [uncultured Caudovirales phage]CAB5208664.1 hypothetical protein UFOVP181_110 [uncultured Caudovirales phage]